MAFDSKGSFVQNQNQSDDGEILQGDQEMQNYFVD